MKKGTLERFVKLARKFGAQDAKVISTKNVFTAPWVRKKCQFGCDMYGQTLTCPPYSPAPGETRKILDSYRTAILVHFDEHSDGTGIIARLEREVFLSGYYKAFGMGEGPCLFCRKCNLKSCMHTEKARPSMEACGIDVYRTARRNGFHIEVLKDTACKGNYFGLLLVE